MKLFANLCYFEKKSIFPVSLSLMNILFYPKKENNKEIHILFCDKLKLKILFYFLKMREEKWKKTNDKSKWLYISFNV